MAVKGIGMRAIISAVCMTGILCTGCDNSSSTKWLSNRSVASKYDTVNKFSSNVYDDWAVEKWTNGSYFRTYEDIVIHFRITKRGGLMAAPTMGPLQIRFSRKTKDGKPVVLSKSFKIDFSKVHREAVNAMDRDMGRQIQYLSMPGDGYEGVVSLKMGDLISDKDDVFKTAIGRWTVDIKTALPDGTLIDLCPIPIIVCIHPEVMPE